MPASRRYGQVVTSLLDFPRQDAWLRSQNRADPIGSHPPMPITSDYRSEDGHPGQQMSRQIKLSGVRYRNPRAGWTADRLNLPVELAREDLDDAGAEPDALRTVNADRAADAIVGYR